MRDQTPLSKASRAFPTAKSTSFASQAATSASVSPVAGLMLFILRPDRGFWNLPSMNALTGNDMFAAIARYSS